MTAADCASGRRRNAQATRCAILEAARGRFAREGYDGAGIREIAGDAGVDAALVSRYFGGKEELFAAVLTLSANPEDLFYGTADAFAARIAKLMVRDPRDDSKMDCLLIMLRSASSPRAGETIRRTGEERFYGPMADWLGGEDAAVLARVLGALMMGMGVARAISVDFELDEAARERLEAQVEATIRTLLAARSPGTAQASVPSPGR